MASAAQDTRQQVRDIVAAANVPPSVISAVMRVLRTVNGLIDTACTIMRFHSWAHLGETDGLSLTGGPDRRSTRFLGWLPPDGPTTTADEKRRISTLAHACFFRILQWYGDAQTCLRSVG